jgi:hypothetical protein
MGLGYLCEILPRLRIGLPGRGYQRLTVLCATGRELNRKIYSFNPFLKIGQIYQTLALWTPQTFSNFVERELSECKIV